MGPDSMPHVLGDKNDPRTSKALPRTTIAYAIIWIVVLIFVAASILVFR